MKNMIFQNRFNKLIIILLCVILAQPVMSQITVDVKIDSMEILIGEQTGITLEVGADAKVPVVFPQLKIGDTLTTGIELVEIAKPDTQFLNDGNRVLISQKYHITSFDTAFYYLPPFIVTADSVSYPSKSLALQVYGMPVDTLNLEQYFGFKDNMSPEFTWVDWRPLFYLSLFVLITFMLSMFLYIRLRDNKPIIRIIKSAPQILPHAQAMNEINQIKQEKVWAKEDSKEYYTRLTATLRTYIEKRFGFSAMEMTSSEIIEKLMEVQSREQLNELASLFNTADLVKFAKYNTMINENDMNLVNAIDFINQTKLSEADQVIEKPKTVTVEEKWNKSTLLAIRLTLSCIIILFICLLSALIWQTYNLLA